MPTIVACPSCSRQLRVPDELLGKQVKCPSCQTIFTAEAPEPPPPPPPAEPEPVPLEPAVPEYASDPFRTPRNEFDSGGRRAGFGEDRFSDVRARVLGPALALIIVKGITMALHCLPMVGSVATVVSSPDGGAVLGGLFQGALIFVSTVIDVLVIYGALAMKDLRSHGWATAACILAVIPTTPCCLLSLPFGIWGLVVLNDPEVRHAYSAVR